MPQGGWSNLKRLLAFMQPFKVPLIVALALTGALTLIGMAPPLLMRRLLNDVAREGQWGLFPLLMALMFAVPLLRALVNIANAIVLNRVGLGIIAGTRKRMFQHLLSLSMDFYGQTPPGAINQRLMGDVATVSGVATGGALTLIADLVALVFAVVVMVGLSGRLTLLTALLLPLYYFNFRFFSRRMREANAQLRSHMDHISSMLQERLNAHELIQSFGAEKEGAAHFSSQARQVMDSAVRGSAYNITFNQLANFLNRLANTVIYCAGCYYFVKGVMGYGDVVAFCAYATQILGPVVRFGTVANQMVQAGVSVDRIQQILDTPPAIAGKPDALPVETLRGDVAIEGVAFDYADGQKGLEAVNFSIPAGTHVGVVGVRGSGRTTLALLLRRLFDPDEGRIAVDGRDIRDYRLRDYRRASALVMSESAIFDGTIRENLCYGNPTAPEERMLAVARAVGLDGLVSQLHHGYDTPIGGGGLRLSSGDRQRLGVARALLAEPFLLVVDDALATLDAVSAEEVREAIRREMEGRTCLIVVHRALLAKDMDMVAVMKDGHIEESGTHEELVAKADGWYRHIFALQYGEGRLPGTNAAGPSPAARAAEEGTDGEGGSGKRE